MRAVLVGGPQDGLECKVVEGTDILTMPAKGKAEVPTTTYRRQLHLGRWSLDDEGRAVFGWEGG